GSLSTEQQGIEVTGHNLANVNNPAYARQRLNIATAPTVQSDIGPQGNGAEGAAIVRLRSDLLDQQISSDISVTQSLAAQQSPLQSAEPDPGQDLDSAAAGAQGGAAASSVGSSHSLADGLSNLFSSFQSLSTDPSSLAQRAAVLGKASDLATQFNQVDQ